MTIKSIAGSLAAYALKRAYDAGKAIEIPSLGIVIKRGETMRYEFAAQYGIVCVVIQPGDTADKVIQDAIENEAVLVDESDEHEDEYCVRFPDRPQELYTASALKRSRWPAKV